MGHFPFRAIKPGHSEVHRLVTYSIRVEKEDFVFSSAHFITFAGHKCESLHGHNYRTQVAVQGALGPHGYVIDFGFIKPIVRSIVDSLDHKVLLASDNPLITINDSDGHIIAHYNDRTYQFPHQDVVLLPIVNTTAELIATHILKRLHHDMRQQNPALHIEWIEVEVDESFGQSGICRMNADEWMSNV